MITFPNAKINLGLNIIEKRPDGYHNLETIFYPINLQDALEVTRSTNSDKEYNLHVSGSALDGEPEDNLVVKAYKLLKEDFHKWRPSKFICTNIFLQEQDWEADRQMQHT